MKRQFLLLSFLVITLSGYSQVRTSHTRQNGVYVEGVLGNFDPSGGFLGFNYDHLWGKKYKRGFRIGVYPSFEDGGVGLPLTLNFISNPNGKSHFEWGFGVMNRVEFYNHRVNYLGSGMIPLMYRYSGKKGLLIRTGFNYLFYYIPWYPAAIQFGLSVGYVF